MTIDLNTLIALAGLSIAVLGFFGAVIRFLNAQVHARITAAEVRFDKELEVIRTEYARKSEMAQAMDAIKGMVSDIKEEGRYVAKRLDDLSRWIADITRTGKEGG